MIKTISSSTNPLIQRTVKLHSSKYRKHYKEFIAEGIRVISTLIAAHHVPLIIFSTDTLLSEAQKLTSEKNIILISDSLMKKISNLESPSGILALFAIPKLTSRNTLTSGIVLVNMHNPGNAGTLLRTAVAMGKKTAIFIEGIDPWNPKVVQASAGAIGHLTVFQLTWDELLQHKKSLILCALVVSGGKQPDAIKNNALIVIGNEACGLSKEKIAQCDEKITLAMPGGFESLNASVAGSIALYLSTINT